MPRTVEEQSEDHYASAHRSHDEALTRFVPGDREYDSLMLEGILHALLDLGVGLAELAAQQRAQPGPAPCSHRCRQGRDCGGCGCDGCGYSAVRP